MVERLMSTPTITWTWRRFREAYTWVVDEDRYHRWMAELPARTGVVFVAGTTAAPGPVPDVTVWVTYDPGDVKGRLDNRTTNNYGKGNEQIQIAVRNWIESDAGERFDVVLNTSPLHSRRGRGRLIALIPHEVSAT